ncbi:MAG: PorV/PorQ family protein, partial [Silvanigrellaceae bacterium]|nr:PorV/PorQ family protein [Silvanigrellaceae bacterium]
GDIGVLHNFVLTDQLERIRLGASIQNIGSKLNGSIYQPMNFSIGATYSNGFFDGDRNSNLDIAYSVGFQLDKPMVPAVPIYDNAGKIIAGQDPTNRNVFSNLFSTWSDAPGGFSENIKQLRYTLFAETIFNKLLALRTGYTHENPNYGNRSYLAVGAGLKWAYEESDYRVNLSYIQPIGPMASNSPLRNTFSLQFLFDFGNN